MAAPLQQFESSWQKEIERKQLKETRERYLEKAKAEYEKREKKKEDAKKRGEGTWMLPSVSDRIVNDEQKVKKAKLKKKKKEKKAKERKEKKEKKSKKSAKKKSKKHKKSSSNDSSSDTSDSDSDAQMKWVPKMAALPASTSGPKLERQDWMVDPMDAIFGGVTRDQMREQKKKENSPEEEKAIIQQAGQHERELNPFWQDGGTGMPEEKSDAKKKWKMVSHGDGGLSWIKKAYQRCQEAAKEEGRTMEDVATERYGSLKTLEKMVQDAEKKSMKSTNSISVERSSSKTYDRDRTERKYLERDRDYGSNTKKDYLSGCFKKPGEGGSFDAMREIEPQRKKLAFLKPGDDGQESRTGNSSSGWRKKESRDAECVPRWKKSKPSHEGEIDSISRRVRSRSRERCSERERSRSRDRRRSRSKSRERSTGSKRSTDKEMTRGHMRSRNRSKDRKSHDPDSSSADSSSDSAEESESSESGSEEEQVPEPVRVMTEDELNALGARILKAEIMGNEVMASKLKLELENARIAKASAPAQTKVESNPGQRIRKVEDEEDKTVVLTRTDRSGNVRPLPAPKHEPGDGGGRRRKEKVSTHAKEGHRERYFADDDEHNLQELVRREKMSTAEDSNMMFARLAGRSIDKTDEEHQIDDVMVQRANKKMSDAKCEERDRSAAIHEHRHMQSTLDRCKFCFENIPKHLIIAIGLKVILCLPAHRSMVPGHCLIVPMQHAVSGTAVEDDVWTEIQVFRKGLTAMFKEQEEDVVFMETSMNLKHHPHMVLEVVPMPVEVGEMAPIFFKKAIQESDTEWAQNKKLIDLSKKNVRNSVPKAFPYFSVDFGLSGGFAHVIEDEQIFPGYFGRSVCGGMMDIEPNLWRKPHKEDFEMQRQKVLRFAAWWKPYDWTQKLKADKDSDSD